MEIQRQLDTVRSTNPRTTEFYGEVLKLKDMSRVGGLPQVLQQAALYSSRRDDSWKAGEFKFFRRLTWQLAGSTDGRANYHVVKALAPLLETDDERLRGFIESYLEAGSPVEEEDDRDARVRAMIDVLHERRTEPHRRIAQVLYWRAPSAALLRLSLQWSEGDEQRMRGILWSEHLIADAVWKEAHQRLRKEEREAALQELDGLSRADEWWIKLYVAEMLRRHAMFRRDDILQRLREDPDPLVAKAADVPYYGGMTENEYKAWKKAIPGIKVR